MFVQPLLTKSTYCKSKQ